ncbi:MAG: type III secretion inner membrane ring lipoprotein SctJ [Sulfitobacter sp.]
MNIRKANGFNLAFRAVLAASLFFIAGCKEVLYSNLSEIHANEMVAVLEASGIGTSRARDKDGIYEISVDGTQIAAAVTILKAEGMPRHTFEDLGTIFSADGIVGTPFEEKARFIYAMNEELSRTIDSIDGVQEARVHIVLPREERFAERQRPASASVAVKVEHGFDTDEFKTKVRTLISHAVDRLDYERVAVVIFEGTGPVVMPAVVPTGGANAQQLPGYTAFPATGIPLGLIGIVVPLMLLFVLLMLGRVIVRRLGLTWRAQA